MILCYARSYADGGLASLAGRADENRGTVCHCANPLPARPRSWPQTAPIPRNAPDRVPRRVKPGSRSTPCATDSSRGVFSRTSPDPAAPGKSSRGITEPCTPPFCRTRRESISLSGPYCRFGRSKQEAMWRALHLLNGLPWKRRRAALQFEAIMSLKRSHLRFPGRESHYVIENKRDARCEATRLQIATELVLPGRSRVVDLDQTCD